MKNENKLFDVVLKIQELIGSHERNVFTYNLVQVLSEVVDHYLYYWRSSNDGCLQRVTRYLLFIRISNYHCTLRGIWPVLFSDKQTSSQSTGDHQLWADVAYAS